VVPLSDVALPPAGIRFIDCTGAAPEAGAFAPAGGAVEGAGWAQIGAEIAIAAIAAALIRRYLMV
jgi:hypothetical protein